MNGKDYLKQIINPLHSFQMLPYAFKTLPYAIKRLSETNNEDIAFFSNVTIIICFQITPSLCSVKTKYWLKTPPSSVVFEIKKSFTKHWVHSCSPSPPPPPHHPQYVV